MLARLERSVNTNRLVTAPSFGLPRTNFPPSRRSRRRPNPPKTDIRTGGTRLRAVSSKAALQRFH